MRAAAFRAEIYDYRDNKRLTYFIHLPRNKILKKMIRDDQL